MYVKRLAHRLAHSRRSINLSFPLSSLGIVFLSLTFSPWWPSPGTPLLRPALCEGEGAAFFVGSSWPTSFLPQPGLSLPCPQPTPVGTSHCPAPSPGPPFRARAESARINLAAGSAGPGGFSQTQSPGPAPAPGPPLLPLQPRPANSNSCSAFRSPTPLSNHLWF